MDISERIEALRRLMQREHLGAYLFTSHVPRGQEADPHTRAGWQWATGLSHESGTAVITPTHAALWTDTATGNARGSQLKAAGYTLSGPDMPDTTAVATWTGRQLADGSTTEAALDGNAVPYAYVQPLTEQLRAAGGITLRTNFDPLPWLWAERPATTGGILRATAPSDGTTSVHERLTRIRRALRDLHADGMLAAAPADIAWALGLSDPAARQGQVCAACLLLSTSTATLYISPDRLTPAVKATLAAGGIGTDEPARLDKGLRDYFEYNILLDPTELSYTCYRAASVRPVVAAPSPIPALRKAGAVSPGPSTSSLSATETRN